MNIDSAGRFILNQFDRSAPFSNFLPGIAGKQGIPLWVFYVNRGQAVTSFGIKSKDEAILEFQPANKTYWMTDTFGFRTFIKLDQPQSEKTYQPFFPNNQKKIKRTMLVDMNQLTIEEENPLVGLKTTVNYFTMPQEGFAALVRQVRFENISEHVLSFEALDGLPVLAPYGVSDFFLKKMARTMEAWMQVEELEQNTPFFRMRAGAEDTADVAAIHAGHFAFAFDERKNILPVFVDPSVVFDQNTSFQEAQGLINYSLADLKMRHQNTGGQMPCALFAINCVLQPGESRVFYEIFGHLESKTELTKVVARFNHPQLIAEKGRLTNTLVNQITDPIFTQTANPIFDQYCRQTYLDNVVRGGYPLRFGDQDQVVHIYGRKHGDPERDYNEFSLAPEPYSQGNANFRDVNQNRRNDLLFSPQVGRFNIHTFVDLIQLDGYNPLVVQGNLFTLNENQIETLVKEFQFSAAVRTVLQQPFTPGKLFRQLTQEDPHNSGLETIFHKILSQAEAHLLAAHGEGYWSDHWDYNLDLIKAYLSIYPEQLFDLCFGDKRYAYYENDHQVNPRDKRYVLTNGQPMQLNAVVQNKEKSKLLEKRAVFDRWVRIDYGNGAVYRSTLFAKLFVLAVVKLATLDPLGMGVEMEGGKPGWYDALNGLPGLFGSSMAETYELKRLFEFLLTVSEQFPSQTITLPLEVIPLFEAIRDLLSDEITPFDFWQEGNHHKEAYREKIYRGISGEEQTYSLEYLVPVLTQALAKLENGIQRAIRYQEGKIPTYFYFKPVDFKAVENAFDPHGNPYLQIKTFEVQLMPLFLEGYVRYLKLIHDPLQALTIYQQVLASPLFDQKLQLYKVNAPLTAYSNQIGRARAFTPGWLENESIWLHMTYKYFLAMLEAGLNEAFLKEIKRGLVPFWEVERYGRSPLENSSFIVSSAHPEEKLHGRGFVARLSGSTAEFLSIWQMMMVGKYPFRNTVDGLSFVLQPTLPGWLFNQGKIQYRFMDSCLITLINSTGQDLTPQGKIHPVKWVVVDELGQTKQVDGETLVGETAEQIRSGKIKKIDVYFEEI